MTRAEILNDFKSDRCRACGGKKAPLKSFCRNCFSSLPRQMQADLYRPFGRGYGRAYERAVKYLGGRNAGKKQTD